MPQHNALIHTLGQRPPQVILRVIVHQSAGIHPNLIALLHQRSLPPLFLIMYHFNPALRPLVVLLGVLCVVSALVAPFVLELRGFHPSLPQVLDLKARTLLVGSMLWPPRPHRRYSLDSPDTYMVVNLWPVPGAAARPTIYAFWHVGSDIYRIPLYGHVPFKESFRRGVSLDLDAAKTDIIGEAIQLADRIGVDIELVGHETIAFYELYLRGLTTEADG